MCQAGLSLIRGVHREEFFRQLGCANDTRAMKPYALLALLKRWENATLKPAAPCRAPKKNRGLDRGFLFSKTLACRLFQCTRCDARTRHRRRRNRAGTRYRSRLRARIFIQPSLGLRSSPGMLVSPVPLIPTCHRDIEPLTAEPNASASRTRWRSLCPTLPQQAQQAWALLPATLAAHVRAPVPAPCRSSGPARFRWRSSRCPESPSSP